MSPDDSDALAVIAALVAADAPAMAEFGGFYSKAPRTLAPLLGDDRRVWILRISGEPAGFLDADRIDDVVHLSYFVAEGFRRRGAASSAVGRFLGMRVWPGARIRAAMSPDNAASQGVARRAGFSPVEVNEWGDQVWERAAPAPVRVGVERYLRADGRIDRYPVSAAERRSLLEWVLDRLWQDDAVLAEADVNARLAVVADDVALLRRRLVDHGLLQRTASGSQYAKAPRADDAATSPTAS